MQTIQDQILGCLYGGAAGDALGYAVEFSTLEAIRARYGPEGIREYALRGGYAEVSDDTQMTLFTVLGLTFIDGSGSYHLAARPADSAADGFHAAYLQWYRTQTERYDRDRTWGDWLTQRPELWKSQAPGNTCLSALESGSCGRIDRPLNRSKGCGGVMRAAPCAFVRAGFAGMPEADTAFLLGCHAAAVTHSHPMGWIPAGMLADIIHRVVFLGEAVDRAARQALAHAQLLFPDAEGMDRLSALTGRALDLAAGSLPDAEAIDALDPAWRGSGGWCGDDALAIALLCAARWPDSMDRCIRAAVNHGGDSDSTGSIAGNIVGARLGLQRIDARWCEPVDVSDAILAAGERLLPLLSA